MSVQGNMRRIWWIWLGSWCVVGLLGCASPSKEVLPPAAPPSVAAPADPLDKLKLSKPMRAAIKEARGELPTFWKAWEEGSWGKGDYIVNAQFLSEDGSRGEFLWLSVQARGEGEVTGLLEGEPTVRKDLKHGQVVTVKDAEIVDWMYVPDDGDHKGGYTLKALGIPAE
ncbi:MAG: DUF2314 domain-containing protein [Fimbriimonadaceae bacterium]